MSDELRQDFGSIHAKTEAVGLYYRGLDSARRDAGTTDSIIVVAEPCNENISSNYLVPC